MGNASTDRELVQRVQQGDKKAFDVLVLKYQHKLTKLVAGYLRDPVEVLDVVQEAFIKAYRALPSFRGDSAFYTWLYRIAINTAKNYLVAQGRRPPDVDIEVADAVHMEMGASLKDAATPESVLQSDEIQQTVFDAIENLPDDLRTAVMLREIEGLSYEEIAQAMQCPIGTVRSRIFRAREVIQSKLKPLLD